MAAEPLSLIAQELAEVKEAQQLADKYGWADDNKDYMSMKNDIRKKYKGLMKMSKMTIKTEMGSSSAKKEKIIWVDSAKKDAGDFTEAVTLLPEVFGPGKYGTSGVNSRGGQQNFKDEICAWKRVAKDGKHYRILEHTTGYFFQEGFLHSQMTEQGEEEDEKEEGEGADEGDNDEEEEEQAPPHPRSRREEARELFRLLCLPRQLRQLPRRVRSRPSARHPASAASRARDTYPRMYPYVSYMYRECILCVMYLRVKIHCILKRILNVS